ncbi:hypothetical protein PLESTF_000738200 [Pleodorina starrii]|nr:hypothetical protein PLESTF_000738200 [Pleodorina starrii]
MAWYEDILIAFGLWASINWLISNVGLTDAEQQQKQLFGKREDAPTEGAAKEKGDEPQGDSAEQDDNKKEN